MTEFVCRRTGQTYEVGEQLDQNGQALVHAVVSAGPDLALKQYLPATLHKRPDLEARIKAMIANPPAYRPDRVRTGDLRVARGRRLRRRAVRRVRHAAHRHPRGDHDPRSRDPARHDLARPGSRRREPGPGRRGAPRRRRRHRRLPGVEPAGLERRSRHPARLRPDAGRRPRVATDGSRASPGGTRARPPSCSCRPRCRARSGRAAATSSPSPCICTCCCSAARTPSEGNGEGAETALRNTCSPRKGCGRTRATGGWRPTRAAHR